MADRALSPAAVAQRFGVNIGKVHRWIASGELRGVNVAERLGGRPRWRITPEALADFESRRAAVSTDAAPVRRRRAKRPAGWIEYV